MKNSLQSWNISSLDVREKITKMVKKVSNSTSWEELLTTLSLEWIRTKQAIQRQTYFTLVYISAFLFLFTSPSEGK